LTQCAWEVAACVEFTELEKVDEITIVDLLDKTNVLKCQLPRPVIGKRPLTAIGIIRSLNGWSAAGVRS